MGNVVYTPVCTIADFYAGGNVRLAMGTIAMSDSYATGGDALTVLATYFSGVGALKTLAILNQPSGYILEYVSNKVKAYLPSGSPTLSGEATHTHEVILDTGASGAGDSHNHAFTGSALATHQHDAITAGTPAGTNATSTVNPRYQADSYSAGKPTIALTHNADPPTNLNASALYIVESDGEATQNVGRLESTNNGNADILGETANGTVGVVAASCRFFVNDNDSPSGVQIYINEGSSDQLEFVSPTDTDAWIIMPFEGAAGAPPGYAVAVKVHDNDAAADGKPLYFDDNGAADAQLIFVDTGAAGGTIPAADVVVLTPTYIGPAADNIGVGLAEAQVFSGAALATHQHAAITAGTPAGTNAAEATHTHGPGTLEDAASAAGSSHTHTATAETADEVGNGTNLSAITGVPVLAIIMLT